MAPENPDRFVVIDGVQVSRARAQRRGLIPSNADAGQPSETRARTSASARRPEGRTDPATALAAQVGDGAISTGEDAARAGAASTPAADASPSTNDASTPPADASTPAGDGTTATPAADTSTPAASTDTPPPAEPSAVAAGDGKAARTRTR